MNVNSEGDKILKFTGYSYIVNFLKFDMLTASLSIPLETDFTEVIYGY